MDTLMDRCDSCGAQAYVKYINAEGFELNFCGHHTGKFANNLDIQGFNISIDTRELLTRRTVGVEVG